MNKKELQRRGKGLLALMLAFIMMFGTSMTVLAATHDLNVDTGEGLTAGDELQGGDTIQITAISGGLKVYIDDKIILINPVRRFDLPAGSNYQVTYYNPINKNEGTNMPADWEYTVKLKTISNPPSGGNTGGGSTGGGSTDGGDTSGGNADSGNTGNSSTPSPEVLEAPQPETGNGGGQPHVHSYGWVTTREATEAQDGLEEYKCACGVVEAQVTIPASQVVVDGFYQTIRGAASDGRITYDTKDFYTLSDKMIACLAERSDVTVEITFIYQKTPYRMTIPAGSDYSALLADEDMFYGYFYFASQIGAKIEPVV